MAIIPQHPVLWLGKLRSNLDPFGTYEDGKLMEVLERVQLSPPSVGSSGGGGDGGGGRGGSERGGDEATTRTSFTLSTPVAEGGLNISLGQCQLICLARALLTRPKILIMDEATSAVDMETDRVVQESIRSELGIDCTLIVIAHKLSTVVDLDRIVVLEQGEVVEVGSPSDLWEREGAFTGMVKESGERGLVEKLG